VQYSVKVDAFEGPLDLLLHLINRYEIDIYDIPVAQITEQYLLYVRAMQELQLDVASEYLVIAATLLAIKSKMLLPKKEEELLDDELNMEYEEDPREELMLRLIEYKKFKEAATQLQEREEDRSQLFSKPPMVFDVSAVEVEDDKQAALNVSLYDMLAAFQKLMKRKKLQKPLQTKVARQEISIEQRMSDIMTELRSMAGRRSFYDLFPFKERESIVVTFLAILELMKQNLVQVEQEGNFDEIFLQSSERA
jgi:segregation and condensation protein A